MHRQFTGLSRSTQRLGRLLRSVSPDTLQRGASMPLVRRMGQGTGKRDGRIAGSIGGTVTLTAAALFALSAPAAAQSVITTNTNLTGTIDGANQGGYMIMSGTVTVDDATVSNFITKGGDGSGGGAGMGGAFFIYDGATLVLNNVDMLHNTAKGGNGGAKDINGNYITTGGALNGGILQGAQGNSGANGTTLLDNALLVGDGEGNGLDGTIGRNGANSNTGIGGNGGNGGSGQDGWATHPILIAKLAFATADYDTKQAAAVAAATTADPTQADDVAAAQAEAAAALAEMTSAAADLALWQTMNAAGRVGMGGDGGFGGNGGIGAFGSGGGAGGNGGNGGDGGGGARDGFGGDGGTGGMGGFGAGGGSGGNGGSGEASGGAGDGGLAGFGGGDGSSGIGNSNPKPIGGGGGAGLGGAIFVYSGGTLLIQGDTTFAGNRALAGGSLNRGLANDQAGTDIFMMAGSNVIFDAGTGHVIEVNGGGGLSISDNTKPKDYAGSNDGMYEGAGIEVRSGLTILNGTNTYAGQTHLTGGVLRANEGEGLSSYSNVNFDGGVLETSGDFTRFLGPLNEDVQWSGSGGFSAIGDDLNVRLNNGQKLTWNSGYFVGSGDALLFGSDFTDADVHFLNAIDLNGLTGRFYANGGEDGASTAYLDGVLSNGSVILGDGVTEGTIVLTAANTYSGTTTVAEGTTVRLEGAGSFGTSSLVGVDGTLDISGTTSGASLVTLGGSGDVVLGSKTLTVTNGSTTYSGEISGTGGLKVAGGNQTLSGSNIFTGPTTIDSGATLSLSGSGSIDKSSTVTANGTLDISNTTSGADIIALLGSGQVALGGQTLTITDASGTFSGAINGTGGLTVKDGTQTLSGTNTYSGKTDIKADATLALSGTGGIADSSEVAVAGSFDISATTGGASIITLSGGGSVALGDQTLSITNGSTTFSGVLAGTGGISITGGDQKLTGVNTFTGDTTIDSGAKLELAGAGAIASSGTVLTYGTLDIANANGAVSIKTLGGSGSVVLGSNDLKLTAGSGLFNGQISGAGGVSLEAGSFTVSGANSFTGKTSVASGATLNARGHAIAASSELALEGTLSLGGAYGPTLIKTLSGDGTVQLNSGGSLNITNASTTFTGDIEGSGTFMVSGGTQTLSGVNSSVGLTAYGGTIIVSGGAIDASGSEAALNITDGGTITTSNVTLTASDSILRADFFTGGKTANFTIGAGTVIAPDNAVLLMVNRSDDGSDGVVNLVIDSGRAANGDIIDSGVITGNGGTNVTIKAGSSWTGLANVTGFDIQAGAAVVFENGSIVDGSLTAAAGSSLFGGTVSAPLTVTGTAYINDGSITGNIYIEGNLALNGLLSPGASPGAISVGGNVNADDYANSKFEVIFGSATQVAGTTYDQLNVGGDLNGQLPLELARYGSTRGDALGDLSSIDLIRVGGTVNGQVVQTNRFTQNGHELFITQRTETASNSAVVIHTPLTEEDFFGPGAVTVFGIDSVVQDETYVLATLPGSLNLATDTILGTYADRRGAALKSESTAGWVRAGYNGTQIDNGLARQEELYYSQAGFRLFSADGFSATALGSYGNLQSDVATELGIAGLSGNLMAGGLELSLAGGGGYIDAVGQYGYSNWTISPTDASSTTINGQTLTGSIEAGYALGDETASITPWVQLAYSASTFSNLDSAWVDAVEFQNGQSATVRGGLRAQFEIGGFSPYAGAALAYDYYDHQDVVVDNFQLGTDNGGARVELTAGMDANLADNVKLTSDFKGSYGITQTDVEISYEGSAGLRATW